jgi:hypothetical protein
MKKNKIIKLENLYNDNLEETLKFIFQIKEKDVFDNEFEMLIEEVQDESYRKIKPLILSNFISSKIKQLNENYSYSNKFLKYSNENFKIDLSHLIDLTQFNSTKNTMIDKLTQNFNSFKNSIKEDIKKFELLAKKKNRVKENNNFNDNDKDKNKDYKKKEKENDKEKNKNDKKEKEKESFLHGDINKDNTVSQKKNEHISIKENKDTDNENDNDNYNNNDYISDEDNHSYKKDNNNNNNISSNKLIKNSNLSEGEDKSNKEIIEYNFKITYCDGNDSLPQKLKIIMNTNMNFENFLYLLKKKLGIYEYAKFKLVSQKGNIGKNNFFFIIIYL